MSIKTLQLNLIRRVRQLELLLKMIGQLFLTIATSLIAYAIYKLWTGNTKYFGKRNLKYVGALYGLKGLFDLIARKTDFVELTKQSYELYPDETILGAFDFTVRAYAVRCPEAFKHIAIRAFNHFEDHRTIFDEKLNPLLSNALVSSKGEKWHRMRAILSPAFTSSKMRLMFNLISECADEVVQHISTKAASGEKINVELKEFFSRYTNDVIATCAFGIKVNSFENPDNEFYSNGKKLTNPGGWLAIARILFIALLPKVAKIFKMKLLDEEVADTFKNMILETMETRQKNNIHRPDMINILMEIRRGSFEHEHHKENSSALIADGFATAEDFEANSSETFQERQWNDDEIVAQCFIFFQAGFEVTSTALTSTAYELVANPDVQRKLYEEIAETNKQLGGKRISYEGINRMKYLDQVISESLRKWPPVIAVDRFCVRDYVYDDGKYKFQIEKGSQIAYSVLGTHRNPKFFPNPDKFDPERFNDENKHHIVSGSYMPFGSGPRNCIGSRFALMELKAILYYLLLNFSIEANADTEMPLNLKRIQLKFHAELKPRKTNY